MPISSIHKTLFTAVITSAMLLQSGCASASKVAAQTATKPSALTGVWQSNGYGYVLDLSSDELKLYHVTDDVCVRSKDSAEALAHYIGLGGLSIAADGQTGSFVPTLEDYPIQMQRIAAVPQICDTPAGNDPISNFDVFTSYFARHYAFFELYNVDWSARVAAARTQVTPQTSDAQLFAVLSNLLEPIKDGHVSISAELEGRDEKFAANPSIISRHLTAQAEAQGTDRSALNTQLLEELWLKSIGGDILSGKGKMVGNNRIQYGMLDDDIAYVNFLAVAGYAGKGLGHEAEDLATLNTILDKAFSRFEKRGAKAVIVDLSMNIGGYDFISGAIASRFMTSETLAYNKRASDSTITEPFVQMIQPHDGKRFAGPVYVLTSNATVSGGEILTLALRTLPQVTHAGQPTRGAFSDVLEKEMPNGWKITLSNEVYTDAQGRNWEGGGITPQLPLTVFEPNNLIGNHRQAVEQLRQMSRANLTKSQQPS